MIRINKILYTIILSILSFNVFAEKFDNHYINNMYNNYIKGIPETKEFEITVYNTTPPINKISNSQNGNNYNKSSNQNIYKNTNNTTNNIYIGLGIGIDFFQNYKTFTKMNQNQIATMKRKDYNLSSNFLIGYKVPNQNINLELEYLTTSNNEFNTSNINERFLLSYNQKLNIEQTGINLIYKLDPLKAYNNITPIFKLGIGFSKFTINDFGLVWGLNGIPVSKETPGATQTEYESDVITQNTNYIKIGIGASYPIYKNTELICGFNYITYNNIILENLKLEELNSINTEISVKYFF